MSFDATRLANAATAVLRAYDPGHDLPVLRRRFGAALAELGSNENPLGPGPRALEAMRAALAEAFRYPDPRGAALKAALAARLGVDAGRITLGNGSHELLMLLAQCFADAAHSIVHAQYGFAVFPIAAAAAGAQAVVVPALPREHPAAPYGHDLEAIAAAVRRDTRIVYLANPNNPTGTWFGDAALAALLARVPQDVLVVVDEAYHEYVDAPDLGTALRFADAHPNLVVTRTFSKAYGLAGLRVGYMIGDPSVAAVLERLRESFNVNGLALAAAEAALGDAEHLQRVRAFNRGEREWLRAELAARGYTALPSQTNFLLVDLGRDAAPLERHLLERGVVVRPMGGYGLPQTLRISIGSRAENARLLEALP
ncbi:histidinol-phosphate aminotransferase [Mizugakiibacter sediminis]|uniref:Histidinol-phosphate aminotransferase n=1 Tax=Mizugakiibacter sediminis TaxID=1475481 RepID=A0A0K8QRG2_9GAMM|nr:histidinol-phosphate transaminase [Mizugakiibacter sediminis]GAP66987.1 histidinol-phosphate aminotransferase [Mizugakiibacter sediminis]